MEIPVASDTTNQTADSHGFVQRCMDYFLHPTFYGDPDALRRARILVATIGVTIVLFASSLFFLTFAPVSAISRTMGIPTAIISMAILILLLFKLKRDASYTLCSQVTVAIMSVILVFATLITGGISASPIAQLLVTLPMMAFFFGGVRDGNSCALIVGLLIAIALLLERNGVNFPQTIEPNDAGMMKSLMLLDGFCAVSALAFVYEYASRALRSERDEEHQKVMQLAQTDPLTGLANRRMFDDMLIARIAQQKATPQAPSFALCYLDLDGFKPINDHHGHDVGDQVLRAISIRLRSSLRGADRVGRHGGDEFMMLLDQLAPGPALEATAQRFLKIIAAPIETSAGLLSVEGSLGFAFFGQHGTDIETLKKSADAAMYDAKHSRVGWRAFGSPTPSANT